MGVYIDIVLKITDNKVTSNKNLGVEDCIYTIEEIYWPPSDPAMNFRRRITCERSQLSIWGESWEDALAFSSRLAFHNWRASSQARPKTLSTFFALLILEIAEAFKLFDKNGDGQISVEELGEAMKQAGQEVCEEDLQEMIKAVDRNGKIFS